MQSSGGGSQAGIGPISQQYAAAATVPLIKSPSLWLPKPVELPGDIHPLPEDITAYFVYPFSLERHVVALQPSPHEAIAQRRARNADILHRREMAEEQKERDALHRIAPGYNPAALLLPKSAARPGATPASGERQPHELAGLNLPSSDTSQHPSTGAADPMEDLVSKLEDMESLRP